MSIYAFKNHNLYVSTLSNIIFKPTYFWVTSTTAGGP